MRLQDLVEEVRKSDEELGLKAWSLPTLENLTHCALGLVGEGSEVADRIKKCWRKGAVEEEDREQIGFELVDCLIYIGKTANVAGVNLDEAWKKKHEILRAREWPKTADSSNLYMPGVLSPTLSKRSSEITLHLLTWSAQGVSDEEQARRLGTSVEIVRQLLEKAMPGGTKLEITTDIAYLLGALASQARPTHKRLFVSKSEEVLAAVLDKAGTLGLVQFSGHLETTKETADGLLSLLTQVSMQDLLAAEQEIKLNFVRGFVDLRGAVTVDGSRLFVDCTNVNALRITRACLLALGFNPTVVFQVADSRYRIALTGMEVKEYGLRVGFALEQNTIRAAARPDSKRRSSRAPRVLVEAEEALSGDRREPSGEAEEVGNELGLS